jgi:hypothetical protein
MLFVAPIDAFGIAVLPGFRSRSFYMHGGGWGTHIVPVPHSWKAIAAHRFPEPYGMLGEIVFVEYLTDTRVSDE